MAAHIAGFGGGQERFISRRKFFGQILEQFVAEELEKQATWSPERYSLQHFRSKHGLEVDCIVELADGQLIPVEIKATRSPTQKNWHNLTRFREKHRDQVDRAVLFHLRDKSIWLEGWHYVLPVSALWKHPA